MDIELAPHRLVEKFYADFQKRVDSGQCSPLDRIERCAIFMFAKWLYESDQVPLTESDESDHPAK